MVSRLPISLAQLNVGNNSEKVKTEVRQFITIWSILFKNGNNLYEHWRW